MTNGFAVLHLLPMTSRNKDVEILTPRYQIAMLLERQLGGGSLPAIARSWRRCYTGCRWTCRIDLGCWRVRTQYLNRHEGISVSHNFVAVLWREHGLEPHRQGTFKLSRDPDFAVSAHCGLFSHFVLLLRQRGVRQIPPGSTNPQLVTTGHSRAVRTINCQQSQSKAEAWAA